MTLYSFQLTDSNCNSIENVFKFVRCEMSTYLPVIDLHDSNVTQSLYIIQSCFRMFSPMEYIRVQDRAKFLPGVVS